MKFFGIEIFGKEKKVVQDQIPEIKVSIPNIKKPALMKPVKDPSITYRSTRSLGRGAFNIPEYDLAEVGRVEDTDSYVRQAMDKKVALMFKEGWDLVGSNPRTLQYIKTRLAQISESSGLPTRQLMRSVGSSLVRKSNSFLVKVRKKEASGGRMRVPAGKKIEIQPVAGYFPLPAEAMEYQLRGSRTTRWRQRMPNTEMKEWNPRDIIHFYHDRKDGFVFGTPITTPVMDDVRALRKIEENIELLVYQHLFPLFQYIVGTPDAPAGVTEEGDKEIDIVKTTIQWMPTEGGIVTPERHEIKVIGAEGRAMRAEGYLEHFKKRVISGLGISAVDLGEGETANRATADNMSRNLIDSVKDYQQVMETFVNAFMINELLLESTFGDSVLDEENRVFLKFKEIDVDSQIKKENHFADLFEKHIISHDESRISIGREPLTIPTREEIDSEEDTAVQFPEWHRMRWKLFEEPKLLIQALDEPWSPIAKAVARNSALDTTEQDINEAGEEKKEQEISLEKERTKAKIAVAKAKPNTNTRPSAPKRKDGFLSNTYWQITRDTVSRVALEGKLDHDWVAQLIRTQMQPTIQHLISSQMLAFRNGYAELGFVGSTGFPDKANTARKRFSLRAERFINKLTRNVITSLKRRVDNNSTSSDIVIQTRAVFESLRFRTTFIEDVEIRKARNFGRLVAMRDQGVLTLHIATTSEQTCTTCSSNSKEVLSTVLATLEHIPPLHAHCNCIMVKPVSTVTQKDGRGDVPPPPPGTPMSNEPADKPLPEQEASDDVASCPECGKTAIRTKDTPDIFNCRACKYSFRVLSDDETEDAHKKTRKQSQFAKCVIKAKSRLRTQHPDWDEGKVEIQAETACDHILQDID